MTSITSADNSHKPQEISEKDLTVENNILGKSIFSFMIFLISVMMSSVIKKIYFPYLI